MRNKIICVLFIFIFLVISCTRNRVGNDSFEIISDGKGNLISEIHYINDSIKHGLAKYYYPNLKNAISDEIEFNYNQKDGWHTHYRKDGSIESKIQFKNNMPHGNNYLYYENGQLKSESLWLNGKLYGAAKWYYENGNLETFNVIDFFDGVLYVIKYDTLGNKIKEEGVVFSPKFVTIYTEDSTETPILEDAIKPGKEVAIKITVAEPPQTNTSINMGVLGKEMIDLPIENHTAIYTCSFPEPGKYILITVGEIKDSMDNIVKYDSLAQIINVSD